MGAIVHEEGIAFRVWAPNANRVHVVGDFNNWNEEAHPLESEGNGYWYTSVAEAREGQQYRYRLSSGPLTLSRIDPYAKEVTNSIGNGVIRKLDFDWSGDDYRLPPRNEIVIYELHIGTFGEAAAIQDAHVVANFDAAIAKLDHLQKLGINVVEVMPVTEFAGDISWGYNPAHLFAVESAYGGPDGFYRFVRECHRRGIGVVLDVVYNHLGPSDLDLWQFDGWEENDAGGIYFYNDWRAETPWGSTRPDYGRAEVRQFLRDNAMLWVEDYHVDGLRLDATVYIRSVRGPADPGSDLPEGWALVQWIARDLKRGPRHTIFIAEDLQDNDWLTKSPGEGGAGFDAQWTAQFVHPVRAAAITPADEARDMYALAQAITHTFNGDGFQRVIYSESHDEVANGKARVPYEVNPQDPQGWFARKRSTLAAALVFSSPGIPMIFQGQEFMAGRWFDDTVPLDWDQCRNFRGITRLYRDLIHLRLNREGVSKGLTGNGIEMLRLENDRNVIAFRRWHSGGPGDDVIVAVNFAGFRVEDVAIPVPAAGHWRLRLNSDWGGYSPDFGSEASSLDAMEREGAWQIVTGIPPYTVLIFSQEPSA
jgi:1,4-alpha-glucan branching enzyme